MNRIYQWFHGDDFKRLFAGFFRQSIILFLVIALSFGHQAILYAKYHPKNPCVMTLSYQVGSNLYYVNGDQQAPMDVAPEIKFSRMFLVIRYVTSEIEGTMMMWDSVSKRVSIILPSGITLNLWIGNPEAEVVYSDGTTSEVWIDEKNHELAPYIKDPGYTMLPMRFVADYLSADNIEWTAKTSTVDLEFVDYNCMNDTETLTGRIEEVTNLDDGTALIIITDTKGNPQRFISRIDLRGDGYEKTIIDYTGFVTLEVKDDWIFSWSPVPDHEPFGVLKSLKFKQLDLILDAQIFRSSNWGMAELTHKITEIPLYFNLVIGEKWVIKNRIILSHTNKEAEQLIKFAFELEVKNGENIENIDYSASLLPDIQNYPPSMRLSSKVEKDNISLIRGLEYIFPLEESSNNNSIPAPPTNQGVGKQISSVQVKDFPRQNCRGKESVPTAISNSLFFLKSRFSLDLSDTQISIEKMSEATRWNPISFGVDVQKWWSHLKKYFENKNYKITTRRFYNFETVINEMKKGFPVILSTWNTNPKTGVLSRGSSVSVTGLSKCTNGFEIDFVYDEKQDDDKKGTNGTGTVSWFEDKKVFQGGNPFINGTKNYYFVVISPEDAIPQTVSTPTPVLPVNKNIISTTFLTTPTKKIRTNKIEIFELKNDQFAEDAVIENNPVYTSKSTPMNSITIPEAILSTDKKYCWHTLSELIDKTSAGVSHPEIFSATKKELEWVTGELDGALTDGTVNFTPFKKNTDYDSFKIEDDLLDNQHEVLLSDYKGFAHVLTDIEGNISDWFALPWMTGKHSFYRAFPIHVTTIFESKNGDNSYFQGINKSGEICTFELNPEAGARILKDTDYIISGSRFWWENEFELKNIKLNTNPEETPKWLNCEITNFEDGIVYARLPSGETSFDFFAESVDENGINIDDYSGCAEIQVVAGTVLEWVAKPEQTVCAFTSNMNFYQLDLTIDDKTTPNSNWFMAEFSSTGFRGCLYLNLSVNKSWVIKNMPIPPMFVSPLYFSFETGNKPGNNISSILYGYSLTPSLRFTKPGSIRKANVAGKKITLLGDKKRYSKKANISPPNILAGFEVEDRATLKEFFLPDYDVRESIPVILSSCLNFTDRTYNFKIDQTKTATNWDEKLGCQFEDGKDYEDVSWWKSLQKYFVKNEIFLQIKKIDDLNLILPELRDGHPVILNARNGDYHYTFAVVSAIKTSSGNILLDIVSDTNQADNSNGILQERISIIMETGEIAGGVGINGLNNFNIFVIQPGGGSRPLIVAEKPTTGSSVITPYPEFSWKCIGDDNVFFSFKIFKMTTEKSFSRIIEEDKPVYKIHKLTEKKFTLPKSSPRLEKDTLYGWYVSAYNSDRILQTVSNLAVFSFSPSDCETIRGEILSTTRDPNTGMIVIEFAQCAISKSFKIVCNENIRDNHDSFAILNYSGCATVCYVLTDDGLFLDSWEATDGDCCKDEGCNIIKGKIIKASETNSEYPVKVEFKPCGKDKKEYFAKSNLKDLSNKSELVGYSSCAEICVLESGLITSWTAVSDDEKCCDEICNDLTITWGTKDKLPPVIFTCPGNTHNLDKIIRLKNDCRDDDITVQIIIFSSWKGVILSEIHTLTPRSTKTQSISFTAPENLPAELTVDIIYGEKTERFIIPVYGLSDCGDMF